MADYQYDGQARLRYAAMAQEWTQGQASRLGVTCDEIMAAIKGGWTAQEVAALPVANAGDLAGPPPRVREARERIREKLAAAPILPIRARGTDPGHFDRRRQDHLRKRRPRHHNYIAAE